MSDPNDLRHYYTEVVIKAGTTIKAMVPCPACQGSGHTGRLVSYYNKPHKTEERCRMCNGNKGEPMTLIITEDVTREVP